MDQSSSDSQNPYASPREDFADDHVSMNLPSLVQSPIYYSGIVKPEEVIAASELALRGSWIAFRAVISKAVVLLSFLILLSLAVIGVLFNTSPLIFVSLSLIAVFSCSILLRRVFLKIKLSNMLQKNLGCYQYTEGIIREDGFEVKSADGYSVVKWSCFKSIRYCDSVVVLYYAKQQGYCFFGRSKFKNANDWQQLISLLEREFPHEETKKIKF